MRVNYINKDSKIENKTEVIACIGYFDGIHTGHKLLIDKTLEIGLSKNMQTAIITFNPDPWMVVNDKDHAVHLTPLPRKIQLLEELGLDEVYIIEFTKSISKLSPEEFIQLFLQKNNITHIVCGEDFKFGFKGQGNITTLKENGIEVSVIPIDKSKTKIGTTSISQNILQGNIEEANRELGYPYAVNGIVIHGSKEGRKIGFPTANLEISSECVLPKPGIYTGIITIDNKEYQTVLNVGFNPTFNTREYPVIESHILDFEGDLYGKEVQQSFIHRLRDELKFSSIDELVVQMNQDKEQARNLLDGYTR